MFDYKFSVSMISSRTLVHELLATLTQKVWVISMQAMQIDINKTKH